MARGVAVYDFQTGWQALGDSVSNTYTPYVYALAVGPEGIYAGGDFTAAGTAQTPSLAQWNTLWKRWQPVGGGLGTGAVVKALAAGGGSLYVGGQFTAAGGGPAAGFARWGQPAREVEVARPQIQGGNTRATATPRPPARPAAAATPTPCPTRSTAGGGAAGQAVPCGRPSRR